MVLVQQVRFTNALIANDFLLPRALFITPNFDKATELLCHGVKVTLFSIVLVPLRET